MSRKKPFVYSNLATSIDGKIATVGREFFGMGSPSDIRLLRKLRNDADSIVYGAEVLRAFQKACLPLNAKHRVVNAVLSRRLEGIDPDWEFFSDERIDRILYVSEALPKSRERVFGRSCEIVRIDGKSAAKAILGDLQSRGHSRVGVEGGGAVMWEFVREGAIDEYYLTLVPRILGGREAPTLVDGVGFDPSGTLNLELKSVKRVGNEIFTVYRPLKKRGIKHPAF